MIGYLPVDERDAIDRRLALAFAQPDAAKGLKTCRELARQLDVKHPDAAASLREGLDDMFTVRRLGVSDRLARSLSCTNDRVDDLGRAYHHRPGQAVERHQDGAPLGRRRDARGRTQLPAHQGLHRHDHPRHPVRTEVARGARTHAVKPPGGAATNQSPHHPNFPPPRPRKPATVYECAGCGTRHLGEQRCPDCATFMHRIGPGGTCPSCDEPVAINELVQP